MDTHVFRVGNRTGIALGADVVAVERALENHVPVEFQRLSHHWLILHGRYTCVARKPQMPRLPHPRPLHLRGQDPAMTEPATHVIGIGNAIVDVFGQADDSFLDLMGIEKGIMQLIERERAELLYAAMREPRQVPGGSVANTMAGLGNLGLRTAFIGRVNDDALGRFYAAALAARGLGLPQPARPGGGLPTSRSMIFVAPRRRAVHEHLPRHLLRARRPRTCPKAWRAAPTSCSSRATSTTSPAARQAFEAAARLTHQGGGQAGIALSDPFCVDRHRADFRRLVRDLDYVIGNQHEWESLYQTDLDSALEQAARDCGLVVCTRSGEEVDPDPGRGAVTVPVRRVVPVDATGAGDLFAAGFLYGLATGQGLEVAGRMGCVAAAEVISHFGARPEADLRALFREAGLL